jgi:putative methyltransferase (TIGR04325 family)
VARFLVPRALLDARYERHFFQCRRWESLHLGIFDRYRDAVAFAERRGVKSGFALAGGHEQWLKDRQDLRSHDYPVMFWLSQVLQEGMRVVDIGGSIGVSYLLFKRYMHLPTGLRWQVYELEEAVSIGRRIAQERSEQALSFTTDIGVLEDASILFSAGALQFLEPTLVQLLSPLERPPGHLLISRVPVTSRRSDFVTLQNTGASITPCRIVNVAELTSGLARLGYRLIDRWQCLENNMYVRSQPSLSMDHFDGFYFSRAPARS